MLIECPALSGLQGIRHAFFTRIGGVSEGVYRSLNGGRGSRDRSGNVQVNRARMLAALGAREILTAYQSHSSDVIIVEAPWPPEQAPHADGLVTRARGLAIGVTTADCGPVLLADVRANVIGAAHAGWKGALLGIIDATVATMERLGAERGRIVAALGPMIRQESYEVGPEFAERFLAAHPGNAAFFTPGEGEVRPLFDLAGYIKRRLSDAGVGEIADLGHCTYTDPSRFYSYRRSTHRSESDYGRHISAIALIE